MIDIQAAVGVKQLEKLDWIISERRKIAGKYFEAFKEIECIWLPNEREGYISNYQSFVLYLKNNSPLSRNDLMQKLLDVGVSTRRGIMTIHREIAYSKYCNSIKLPLTEDTSDRSIIIPLYIPMGENEVNYVLKKLPNY